MEGALPISDPKAEAPALQRAAVRLAALAQPSRLAIVRHLIQAGPEGLTPGALALALEIRPSTLSFHLKELLHCGLVQAQPQGRHIVYRAGYVQMRELIEFLTVHCCAGTPCELTSLSASMDLALPDRTGEDANCCPPTDNTPIMTPTPLHVLFLCTHNSARSILAEALLNHLGQGRFRAHSAGSQPKTAPNPLALRVLEQAGIPIEGLRSKSWDEFAAPESPTMDLVITVCDHAASEACPYWPGHPVTVHWGYPDPSAVAGDEATRLEAFQGTMLALRQRIEALIAQTSPETDCGAIAALARRLAQS